MTGLAGLPETPQGLAPLYEAARLRPRDAETGPVSDAFGAMVRARGSFSVDGVRYSWSESEGCVYRRPDPTVATVIQRGRVPVAGILALGLGVGEGLDLGCGAGLVRLTLLAKDGQTYRLAFAGRERTVRAGETLVIFIEGRRAEITFRRVSGRKARLWIAAPGVNAGRVPPPPERAAG